MAKALSRSNAAIVSEWRARVGQLSVPARDMISPSPLNLLANTLNEGQIHSSLPALGTTVPATWHHIYFPPRTPPQDLAHDGYETDFFPPPPFMQRLWAGAKYTWGPNALRIGDEATLVTTVESIDFRQGGKLGDTVFVRLNKDINNERGWSMREQRTLAYTLERPVSDTRIIPVSRTPDFYQRLQPSPVLLFRYSALTFNAHMIHYDHKYATQQEGYPACLVHGPLSGTLLVSLVRAHLNRSTTHTPHFSSFQYSCLAPLYVNRPLTLCGRLSSEQADKQIFDVWVLDNNDSLAVKGTIEATLKPKST